MNRKPLRIGGWTVLITAQLLGLALLWVWATANLTDRAGTAAIFTWSGLTLAGFLMLMCADLSENE